MNLSVEADAGDISDEALLFSHWSAIGLLLKPCNFSPPPPACILTRWYLS